MNTSKAGGALDVRVRCLTPLGKGAVSVLEFCGPDAPRALAQLGPLATPTPGEPRLVRVRLADSDCDEALLVVRSPVCLELHVHGNPLLVEEILAACALGGARTDVRASENMEARALASLAHCQSLLGARILVDQAQGALRREIQGLCGMHGQQQDVHLDVLLERSRRARFALRPAQVLLAGPVNAGKSTLFNLMFGRERVIAHQTPGTTRDLVRESVRLGGFVIDLWDCAGLRPADPSQGPAQGIPPVEWAGIRAALAFVEQADLVLWLVPQGVDPVRVLPPDAQRGARWCVLRTHDDSESGAARDPNSISVPFRPQAAALLVQEVIASALELDQALWTKGQGVPFELEQELALGRLLREDSPAVRQRELAAWLAAS